MSTERHRIRLEKVGPVALRAVAGSGGEMVIDGKREIGGEDRGMRPMEALLTSLASCTAMDVMFILKKQREPLERLTIDIEGERADAVPSPFTKIHMRFVANREVALNKFQRAVALSEGKYCSVKASLSSEIEITFEAALE
ncbi:MAG: OsmC family protein [Myxococcota bacterium]